MLKYLGLLINQQKNTRYIICSKALLNIDYIKSWSENHTDKVICNIIKRALTEDPTSTATTTTINPNFPIGMRINCFHHPGNLQGEASENEMESLDLFLNRPKVQFEFDEDVANMKDMFNKMTEEEIKGWKLR